jgi:hypothetical protein
MFTWTDVKICRFLLDIAPIVIGLHNWARAGWLREKVEPCGSRVGGGSRVGPFPVTGLLKPCYGT